MLGGELIIRSKTPTTPLSLSNSNYCAAKQEKIENLRAGGSIRKLVEQ